MRNRILTDFRCAFPEHADATPARTGCSRFSNRRPSDPETQSRDPGIDWKRLGSTAFLGHLSPLMACSGRRSSCILSSARRDRQRPDPPQYRSEQPPRQTTLGQQQNAADRSDRQPKSAYRAARRPCWPWARGGQMWYSTRVSSCVTCVARTVGPRCRSRCGRLTRLDRGYEDLLTGKITDQLWARKSREWESELEAALDEVARHDHASSNYTATAPGLELSQHAYSLYVRQEAAEQRRLLNTLLSNCTFEGGSLTPTYNKFDPLVAGNGTGEWLGGRDSNPDYTVQSRVSYH